MNKVKTLLILSAIQCDFFSNSTNKELFPVATNVAMFKDLKQFVNIIQKNKELSICIVIEETKNMTFFALIYKYLQVVKNKKIKILTSREALECKTQAVFLFFYDKKQKNSFITKASRTSYSFPLVFNYKNRKNISSFYKIAGSFSNYKQFLFLISLISAV